MAHAGDWTEPWIGEFVARMDLRAELGAVKVQTVPLDPDTLSVPERALLPEWIADHWRRRKEAQDRAAAERKANANKGK